MRRSEITLDLEGGTKIKFVLTDLGLQVTADGNEVDIADLLPFAEMFRKRGVIFEVIHSRIDLRRYVDVARRCLWQYDEVNNATYVLCIPKSTVEKQRILYVLFSLKATQVGF